MFLTSDDYKVLAKFSKRVERGAKLLDEIVPGWEEKINIETFDLSRADVCIAGQVFMDKINGTYENGFDYALNEISQIDEHSDTYFGLNIPETDGDKKINSYMIKRFGIDWDSNNMFEVLSEFWIELLQDREIVVDEVG